MTKRKQIHSLIRKKTFKNIEKCKIKYNTTEETKNQDFRSISIQAEGGGGASFRCRNQPDLDNP